jgi:DNA-binding winged helix-turn-helix (wHTH) protein
MLPPQSSPTARTIRFGAFAVEVASGELRKGDVRIRLQEQPFQVLAVLLDHHGRIVTREELRRKLWPEDTFVDFDHSLNTAVNKIREALDDSASSPRYVETVAKRGYRFIGTINFERGGRPTACCES